MDSTNPDLFSDKFSAEICSLWSSGWNSSADLFPNLGLACSEYTL